MTCILIDDDPEEIEIFNFAIRELQRSVSFNGYTSYDSALEAMTGEGAALPDYIFLDGFMHLISGKEALARIKLDSRLRHIPVIIYSGYVTEHISNELLALGAVAILEKPSGVDALRRSLEDLFSGNSI